MQPFVDQIYAIIQIIKKKVIGHIESSLQTPFMTKANCGLGVSSGLTPYLAPALRWGVL